MNKKHTPYLSLNNINTNKLDLIDDAYGFKYEFLYDALFLAKFDITPTDNCINNLIERAKL